MNYFEDCVPVPFGFFWGEQLDFLHIPFSVKKLPDSSKWKHKKMTDIINTDN